MCVFNRSCGEKVAFRGNGFGPWTVQDNLRDDVRDESVFEACAWPGSSS